MTRLFVTAFVHCRQCNPITCAPRCVPPGWI